MFRWCKKVTTSCCNPVQRYDPMSSTEDDDDGDQSLWSKDIGKHCCGEYSFAVVQANAELEDHSQVETGRDAVYFGVYDGHGGPEAAMFVRDRLFYHLVNIIKQKETISDEVIKNAFSATEEEFITVVRGTRETKPLIAAVGSCCLVGFIYSGILYIANLGDSRAVLGTSDASNKISPIQLTDDHNANKVEVRNELSLIHPDDPSIVVFKQGIWRVKGIIQVSRSIGDAYMKSAEFNLDPSYPRFHLPEPIRRPALSAVPAVRSRTLERNDKFIIVASDGLWENLSNEEAVQIVQRYPKRGIAKKLVKRALYEAARKRNRAYIDIKRAQRGQRRIFHDDITVIVIFIDHQLVQENEEVPELSVRGFSDSIQPSSFNILEGGLKSII